MVHPFQVLSIISMCAKEQPTAAADDDVWGEGDSDTPEQAALDREWETRHQQFYNVSYVLTYFNGHLIAEAMLLTAVLHACRVAIGMG